MSEKKRVGLEALEMIAGVLEPLRDGFSELPRSVALYIDLQLVKAGFSIVKSVPADQWEIVVDELVLIYVVHENAKYEKDERRRRREWEAWCVGSWTSFNKGGWTWHGLCGQVTHVAPLPARPR